MEDLLIKKYREIKIALPENVELVAVSKNHPADKILELYQAGQKVFGENKVQELLRKYEQLPKDIQWHLIGHLQTNKIKSIASFVDTIQSLDSEKLLIAIEKEAAKNNRKINILLQVKIAEEDSKFGLSISEAKRIFDNFSSGKYPNIEITGLMGMATFTHDENQIRQEFLRLKKLFDELSEITPLKTLSMGMSGDYLIAIECGANSVRIGSSIFGERVY